MKKLFLRDQRGFTLIELLIVIAIIAILAAIAIPQYSKYRLNAAKAAVSSDAKNCVNLVAAYATDLLQNPSANAPTYPTTCTTPSPSADPLTCTCSKTVGGTAVQCTATEGGSVTCTP